MENTTEKKEIKVVKTQEAMMEGCIGKYLNKHIAPGRMYVVEDDTNLVGSCLYNIDKPMMVITYKSYRQFLKDATKSEIEANLSDSEKTGCNISDEMITKKQLELCVFGMQMKGHKVILIDDYQSIVEDWYQEWSQEPTALQRLLNEYGITVIASKCPLTAKVDDPVEMAEPVLWMTDKYSMENRFEKAEINIVRMSFGVNDDLGTALKRILLPSQLYVIDKTSEIATSFYYSLVEPSVVFTITKSSTQFIKDLMWSRINSLVYTVGIDMGVVGKRIKILENLPMWVDDTKFQSVAELCEKCRQMKEERNIQFVVIDDFMHLPIPEIVLQGREEPDAVNKQLCRLAKELDIAVVALVDSSANDTYEHHRSHRRKKRNQAKGLDAILRAGYAE